MKSHILIVEDDLELAEGIANFLINNNLTVTVCARPQKLVHLLKENTIDLILCDVSMPTISGFDLMKQVADTYQGRFIFLTAMDKLEYQLKGYGVGACDYLIKPIDPRILLAKIQATLKFTHTAVLKPAEQLCIENLAVNFSHRTAEISGKPLALTSSEFDLLQALVENHGQFVSREWYFSNYLHKEYMPYDRTMDGTVSRLRNKIRSTDHHWNIIVKWGKGYTLQYEKSL